MAKNNAKLTDVNLLISAGINPKTGLPYKFGKDRSSLYPDMKKLFRIKDEQSAVSRYLWKKTHLTITSPEIERFFYYKYCLAFFNLEGKFYLMPFALEGGLDFYARENTIHPVPFAEDDSEGVKAQKALLAQVKLIVIKTVDDALLADPKTSAVIIRDYTPQNNIQRAIPRATLQDSLLDFEAQIIPYMRTAIINSTGVQGVKASDSDEAEDILEASESVNQSALNGNPWIPITQKLDRTPLTMTGNFMAQNYLMAIQGIDNLRESFYGTAEKGIYTKAEHTNDSENEMDSPLTSPLIDGLNIRQNACNIINAIWHLGISVEVNKQSNSVGIEEGGKEDVTDPQKQPKNIPGNLPNN